jgi:hypothetical protein
VRPEASGATFKIRSLSQTLSQRASEAFDPENFAELSYGQSYVERILANIDAAEAQLRRTVIAIVALVAFFFLFAHSKSSELSLGPLTLSDVKGVLTLVPPVVAYLLYEFVAAVGIGSLYATLLFAVTHTLYPSLWKSDLDTALLSVTQQVWGDISDRADLSGESPITPWLGRLGRLIGYGFMIGILAFLVYAYATLAGSSKTSVPFLIASGLFTLVSVSRAGLEFVRSSATD